MAGISMPILLLILLVLDPLPPLGTSRRRIRIKSRSGSTAPRLLAFEQLS
jgi:hypothetical protein